MAANDRNDRFPRSHTNFRSSFIILAGIGGTKCKDARETKNQRAIEPVGPRTNLEANPGRIPAQKADLNAHESPIKSANRIDEPVAKRDYRYNSKSGTVSPPRGSGRPRPRPLAQYR